MTGIFKAYDIRGIYPSELDAQKAYLIGKAFADIIKKEVMKDQIKIAVGRDMRVSSPELSKNLIQGLLDQGIFVTDIGLVSTPTFYFGVSKGDFDGGMQISASHNPKEYNGVKIVRSKARPFSYGDGIEEIERKILENDFEVTSSKGTLSYDDSYLKEEISYALSCVDYQKLPKMKIVADVANAMSSPVISELFTHLDSELVKMNFELDGTFPAHQADPFQEKNVVGLKKKVIEEHADLGIATDGDGDRIFFIDDTGEMVDPSILRGLLAKIYLREYEGGKVCYDIRPGKITKDMIVENGGIPIITKVGHSLIKKKALEEDAIFAGESSGHFFIRSDYGFFEMPAIVILKIMKEISNEKKKLSEIVKPLQKYFHSGEINIVVEDKEKIFSTIKEKYADGNIIDIDGITVEFDDYWFNIRASNTEPKIRLNLEAISEEIMEKRRDDVLRIIEDLK